MSFPATLSASARGLYGAAAGLPARPAAAPGRVPAGYASQASRYKDAELDSASPGQLIVMLFDKILLTLRRGRLAMEQKRIEERVELLLKANEMIAELRLSLDFEQGGQIATELDALYGYALREVMEANRTQDPARLDVVLHIVGELRDAFGQIVAGGAGGHAAPVAVGLDGRSA